jgi:hypothetical protein
LQEYHVVIEAGIFVLAREYRMIYALENPSGLFAFPLRRGQGGGAFLL